MGLIRLHKIIIYVIWSIEPGTPKFDVLNTNGFLM